VPRPRVDIDSIATDSGFSETTFDGIGFGLGVSVIIDPIKASLLCSKGEYGWGGWASTFFAVDPDEQMVIMSLAQLAPSDRYPLRRQLRCLVYQALLN
jgi:CubicO group peptidase (beta-lactamase class C family)